MAEASGNRHRSEIHGGRPLFDNLERERRVLDALIELLALRLHLLDVRSDARNLAFDFEHVGDASSAVLEDLAQSSFSDPRTCEPDVQIHDRRRHVLCTLIILGDATQRTERGKNAVELRAWNAQGAAK